MSDGRPIGVFDSGLGGLTVVSALADALPGEDIVYLGDSARVPYGIKSLSTVRRFATEDAAFLGRFDPKLIVIACNTASAAAIDEISAASSVPVIDVIRPGVRAALAASDGDVGVIATEATIRSGAYQREIAAADPSRNVHVAFCPLLVPIVEEGRQQNDSIVTYVLTDYLYELQRKRPATLILGCTHYPLLSGAIGKLMGPGTQLISSGAAAAAETAQYLVAHDLCNPNTQPGRFDCYTTDNPERFADLSERFGPRRCDSIHYVGTDELETFTQP